MRQRATALLRQPDPDLAQRARSGRYLETVHTQRRRRVPGRALRGRRQRRWPARLLQRLEGRRGGDGSDRCRAPGDRELWRGRYHEGRLRQDPQRFSDV